MRTLAVAVCLLVLALTVYDVTAGRNHDDYIGRPPPCGGVTIDGIAVPECASYTCPAHFTCSGPGKSVTRFGKVITSTATCRPVCPQACAAGEFCHKFPFHDVEAECLKNCTVDASVCPEGYRCKEIGDHGRVCFPPIPDHANVDCSNCPAGTACCPRSPYRTCVPDCYIALLKAVSGNDDQCDP